MKWARRTPREKMEAAGITEEKQFETVAHIYGGATALGGGDVRERMQSYALCGRYPTYRDKDGGITIPASGRIHKYVSDGGEPTCEKCRELKAKNGAPALTVVLKDECPTEEEVL